MEKIAQAQDDVLQVIKEGSATERREALEALTEAAQASTESEPRNRLALGLIAAGRHQEAAEILQDLVQAHPEVDIYRLTLATTHSQMGQVDLTRAHLVYLTEHGSSEEIRTVAREQLSGMDRFHGQTEADARLRKLHVAARQERILNGNASPQDYHRLAFVLLTMGRLAEPGGGLREATAVLEAGRTRFPEAVPILELLASCYLRDDPGSQLTELLLLLERLAPDSPVIAVLRDLGPNSAEDFRKMMLERALGLVNQAKFKSTDQSVQRAALRELTEMVRQFPNDTDYKTLYAFALLNAGSKREAVDQANALAARAGESHTGHFNIGQILWLAGESERGRRHLELALTYAQSPQDREDVLQPITLRACSTGVQAVRNRGDELDGLTRAVLYAGSSAVVVSLWNVDLVSSQQLLARFYRYWRGSATPMPTWRALWMAQRDMFASTDEPHLRHPYHWAPFVLIGDWE